MSKDYVGLQSNVIVRGELQVSGAGIHSRQA